MRIRHIFTAAVLLLGLASAAGAYTQIKASHPGGATWTLCSAETGTGVCDNASGVDFGATVAGFKTLNFDATQSTGTYSCEIYGGGQVVGLTGTDLSTFGSIIGAAPLSGSLEQIAVVNASFYAVWINCTSNTGSVTITVQGTK